MAENTGPAVVVSGTSNTAGQTETTLVENGINRDTDNTTVTGNEVTTGALTVDISVDIGSIVNAKDNIVNLKENLGAIAGQLGSIVGAAYNAATNALHLEGKERNYNIANAENLTQKDLQNIALQTDKIDKIIEQTGDAPSIEEQLDMNGVVDPSERARITQEIQGQIYLLSNISEDREGEDKEDYRKNKLLNGDVIERGEDKHGKGAQGASRKNGIHLGLDINTKPGEDIYAVEDGTARSTFSYGIGDANKPNSAEKANVPAIAITTNNKDRILNLYVIPTEQIKKSKDKGVIVKAGDKIGVAYDIAGCYASGACSDNGKPAVGMTNHLHFQINKTTYKGASKIDKPNHVADVNKYLEARGIKVIPAIDKSLVSLAPLAPLKLPKPKLP